MRHRNLAMSLIILPLILLCSSCGSPPDEGLVDDDEAVESTPAAEPGSGGAERDDPAAVDSGSAATDEEVDPEELPALEIQVASIHARHEDYFGDRCLMLVLTDDPDFECDDILYGVDYMAVYFPQEDEGYGQPIGAKYRHGDEQESFSSHGSPGAISVDADGHQVQGWIALDALGDGDAVLGRFAAELCP